MASSVFDLDTPLSAVGLSQEGFDAFAGNVGNLLIEGAGISAGYKLVRNVADRLSEDLTEDEIISKLGIQNFMETKEEDNENQN